MKGDYVNIQTSDIVLMGVASSDLSNNLAMAMEGEDEGPPTPEGSASTPSDKIPIRSITQTKYRIVASKEVEVESEVREEGKRREEEGTERGGRGEEGMEGEREGTGEEVEQDSGMRREGEWVEQNGNGRVRSYSGIKQAVEQETEFEMEEEMREEELTDVLLGEHESPDVGEMEGEECKGEKLNFRQVRDNQFFDDIIRRAEEVGCRLANPPESPPSYRRRNLKRPSSSTGIKSRYASPHIP